MNVEEKREQQKEPTNAWSLMNGHCHPGCQQMINLSFFFIGGAIKNIQHVKYCWLAIEYWFHFVGQ